jgi:sulfatase maturation enzyme AslB (radical SAM superfamily)
MGIGHLDLERLNRALIGFSEHMEELGLAPRTLKSLSLVLTTGCNLRCGYCYADRKGGRSMPWQVAHAALELVYRRGCPHCRICLYGGEPLLHLSMVQRVVDYIRQRWSAESRPEAILCTNGTLLDQRTVQWLVDRDVRVQLSSDGVEPAQAQRGEGTFQVLDTTLGSMARDHPQFVSTKLVIKLTLTAANLPYLAKSIEYLMGFGVASIDVIPLDTHDPMWTEESASLLEEQLEAVRKLFSDRLRSHGTVPSKLLDVAPPTASRRPLGDGMCGFGQGTDLVVDVDGSLIACSALVSSFQSIRGELHRDLMACAAVGNILTCDESALVAELRRRRDSSPVILGRSKKWSNSGPCRECEFFAECFVCPVSIAHVPGSADPHRIPRNQCEFNKAVGRQREKFRKDIESQAPTN